MMKLLQIFQQVQKAQEEVNKAKEPQTNIEWSSEGVQTGRRGASAGKGNMQGNWWTQIPIRAPVVHKIKGKAGVSEPGSWERQKYGEHNTRDNKNQETQKPQQAAEEAWRGWKDPKEVNKATWNKEKADRPAGIGQQEAANSYHRETYRWNKPQGNTGGTGTSRYDTNQELESRRSPGSELQRERAADG